LEQVQRSWRDKDSGPALEQVQTRQELDPYPSNIFVPVSRQDLDPYPSNIFVPVPTQDLDPYPSNIFVPVPRQDLDPSKTLEG
jgi:hypothetical protein